MANLPYTRLQLRRGDKSWWETNNPVLAEGEPGVEIEIGTGSKKTKTKMKIGDGKHTWKDLSYMSGSGGGGSTVICTIKPNKTVFEYGSKASIELALSITGDYDRYELKLGSNLLAENEYQETINNFKYTFESLTESKTIDLIVYSGDMEISRSSIKIQPGYYIYYWSDNVSKNNDQSMMIPENKLRKGLLTSATTDINAPDPYNPQSEAQLFIALPSIWRNSTISNSGFVSSPNKEWTTNVSYNELSVDYIIYSIGDVGISKGTIISIKS